MSGPAKRNRHSTSSSANTPQTTRSHPTPITNSSPSGSRPTVPIPTPSTKRPTQQSTQFIPENGQLSKSGNWIRKRNLGKAVAVGVDVAETDGDKVECVDVGVKESGSHTLLFKEAMDTVTRARNR